MSVQHADLAKGQQPRVAGDAPSDRMAYWRRQLDGAPEALELPTDRPRPPIPKFRSARASFALSIGLTESLRALSRREDVALFVTLLAAFKTLLFRYTGQEDVVVGSVTPGRGAAQIEGWGGSLPNTLALRTDLAGNPAFRDLLWRVREAAVSGVENEVPWIDLARELRLDQDPRRNTPFQVAFSVRPAPEPVEIGSNPSRGDVETAAGKCDLHLVVDDDPESLSGSFVYNADLFDASTVDRIATKLALR